MSATPPLLFDSPQLNRGDFAFDPGRIAPRAGRVTVLLGPNGGGKTTALRLAAGLLLPRAGAALIDGVAAHLLPAGRRAGRMAFVPQRPEVGAPFRVREVVELGRHSMTPDGWRVAGALRAVGLIEHAERPYHALSAGQQQRVTIARALAQHQRGGILLLDEAFAAVDAPEAATLVRLLRALAREDSTVLVATHDLALASALADDAWFLRDGRTLAFGSAGEVLAAGRLGALLGMPVAEARSADGRSVAVADFRAMLSDAPETTEQR